MPVSAFEEPEAHLHPHAQQAAFRQLDQFAGQKLITTHSAHLATVADPLRVRRFERSTGGISTHRLPSDADETVVTSLRRYVLRRTPEALFARLVILVEGETDEAALPVFAAHHWAPLDPGGQGLVVASAEGAPMFKNVVPALEGLGIPWLIAADGDRAGADGVSKVSRWLGRDITTDPPLAFLLPDGHDLETYLVADGHGRAIETAIDEAYGAEALDTYRWTRDTTQRSDGSVRDYSGADGQRRLLVDYLQAHKGAIGAVVATHIVQAGAGPASFTAVFNRAEELLEGR